MQSDAQAAPVFTDSISTSDVPLDEQLLLKTMVRDNTDRARGGTFIYPLLWLVVCYFSGWHVIERSIFLANFCFLIGFAIVRIWVLFYARRIVDSNLVAARLGYLSVILINALHWGVVTALAINSIELQAVKFPLLLSACGIAAAGTAVMSIDRLIRFLFPCFVVLPVTLTLMFHPSTENILFAVLCLVFTVYMIIASKSVHQDYWQAIRATLLLERRAAELHRLSITDTLTQLHNRLHFEKQYQVEWRRACRSGQSIAVLLIDLDHFKNINDNYGHYFGDQCLITVANVLKQQVLRAGDFCARYGGEEFIIILPNTEEEGARVYGERIREALQQHSLEHQGHAIEITASIGIACSRPNDIRAGHQLIVRADKALYVAKERGRDRVEIYSQEPDRGRQNSARNDNWFPEK